jgi:hypothetical protein
VLQRFTSASVAHPPISLPGLRPLLIQDQP